jgi:hypothetical protein
MSPQSDPLSLIQHHFHQEIKRRADEFRVTAEYDLPDLKKTPEGYVAIPGMYGGFSYKLAPGPVLKASSWSRVVGGSEQSHVITSQGCKTENAEMY